MAKLLLWILSLAASFLLPATGEVVDDFQNCHQFFLGGNPPNLVPKKPARICQMYEDEYRFATMYDRDGRIPLYSAYKYQPFLFEFSGEAQMDWKIEPQLVLRGDRERNMQSEKASPIDPSALAKSQAVLADYENIFPYSKGQLLPPSHQPDRDSKAAAYTLTNVVPQYEELLNGEWAAFLSRLKQNLARCTESYVIVGVVPSDEYISGHRVNKPSHIWAAVCCLTQKKQKDAWGVIAENNQNKVERFNLEDLEGELNRKYKRRDINLFNGACN